MNCHPHLASPIKGEGKLVVEAEYRERGGIKTRALSKYMRGE